MTLNKLENNSNISNPLVSRPLWLLAELTYRCPLQCAYCSNPLDYAQHKGELSTEEWLRVLSEGRKLGAVQLGFSGGEPLVRQDLEILIKEARSMGYYTNLITSTIGMDIDRVAALKKAGLDHIQISFQASSAELNDLIAGTESFEHKKTIAQEVKKQGFGMVLNFVIHKGNIDYIEQMLQLAISLEADYVELASSQYYGFALLNREHLLPSKEQVEQAEAIAHRYQAEQKGKMKIYYIIPDYYEKRPKPCMNGWGKVFLTIAPDGTALPCHSARLLPGIEFPNVKEHDLKHIWYESPSFNRFRGDKWMKEPCRTCPEKEKDFGGCRCQAYLLSGDAEQADPVCDKSPHHHLITEAITQASSQDYNQTIVMRNSRNSKAFNK